MTTTLLAQILDELKTVITAPQDAELLREQAAQLTAAKAAAEQQAAALSDALAAASADATTLAADLDAARQSLRDAQVRISELSAALDSAQAGLVRVTAERDALAAAKDYTEDVFRWSGTLDTGDWKLGRFTTLQHDNGLSVVIENGVPVLVHTVSNLQKPVNSARHHRAEVCLSIGPGDLQEGDTAIDRVEVFIPANFPIQPVDKQWRVLPRQRHEVLETSSDGPADAMELHQKVWRLRGTAGLFDKASNWSGGVVASVADITKLFGRWVPVETRSYCHSDPTKGWHEVSIDGVKFPRVYMATMIVDPATGKASKNYVKFGLYMEESTPLTVIKTRGHTVTRRRPE